MAVCTICVERLPLPCVTRSSVILTTGVLSRSLSSSSSSLDSRHGPGARPRPLPRQRLPARQRRERASLSPRTVPSPALHSYSGTTVLTPAGLYGQICRFSIIRIQLRKIIKLKHLSLSGIRSRTPSASSSVCEGPEVRLGERVLVVGQRTGVVQFYGKTSFAPGQFFFLF